MGPNRGKVNYKMNSIILVGFLKKSSSLDIFSFKSCLIHSTLILLGHDAASSHNH